MSHERTFGSLFSGIGGLDLGLERAGWRPLWQCEKDSYRRSVLADHWPDVPRAADVREVPESAWTSGLRTLGGDTAGAGPGRGRTDPADGDARPDLICGGFPCQDVSVAGRRAGLAGEHSGLFFEFARVLDAVRPRWLLIENVPGLFTSHGGRDFAVVLATLADLGYGVAWRVLDSRYFGVPQRRRRVFIVGHLGARSTDPFLPFLDGGRGHPASRVEAGEEAASGAAGGSRTDQHYWVEDIEDGTLTASNDGTRTDRKPLVVTGPMTSKWRKGSGGPAGDEAQNLVAFSIFPEPGQGSDLRAAEVALSPALSVENSEQNDRGLRLAGRKGVRRLTPLECARLQGFPDDWLSGNEPPAKPKYAALGDAVTVPVAEWIGRRLPVVT